MTLPVIALILHLSNFSESKLWFIFRGGKNIFLSGTIDPKSNEILPTHVRFGNGLSNKNTGLPSSNLE